MKTLVPMIYKDFHCIGSACRDNCCIGWEIDIDDRTAEFYRSVSGPFGDRLRENIDWDAGCFRLTDGERCPFLNDKNLCDLIIELGEEQLCDICDRHPRFRNVLPGRVEMGVGLCCEEAVRQLLSCEEKMVLVPGPDVEEEPAEADRMLVGACGKVRELAFSVLQDRELSLKDRVRMLLSIADDLWLSQDDTGEGQLEVCDRYADHAGMPGDISQSQPENVEKQRIWKEISEIFLSLERLDESWTPLIERLAEPVKERELPDIPFEQLIWYFLFRHLMAALEDGDTTGGILFAVASFLVIRRLVQQGGDLYDIVRRYSKEIEYSTENMDALYDAFYWNDCFRMENLIALL